MILLGIWTPGWLYLPGGELRKGAQDEQRFQEETNKDVRTLQDEAKVSGRNQNG